MTFLVDAFLLGLSISPFCLSTCGPILAPFMVGTASSFIAKAKTLTLFLAGRFFGYMAIGLGSGLVGKILFSNHTPRLEGWFSLATGLLLILASLMRGFPTLSWCRWLHRALPGNTSVMVLGLLSGLNLCPPFVAAILNSAVLASVSHTLLYFLVFFLATSLVFPLFLLLAPLAKIETARVIADICMVLAASGWCGKVPGCFSCHSTAAIIHFNSCTTLPCIPRRPDTLVWPCRSLGTCRKIQARVLAFQFLHRWRATALV